MGPERIIETASGGHYCTDCHTDITGGENSTDRDRGMYVAKRLDSGICGCCGVVVDAGEFSGHAN